MSDLYDTPADILAKALRGRGEMPGDAAHRAGLPIGRVGDFLKGDFEPDTARDLASALDLDPEALSSHAHPWPEPELPPGVRHLELPFDDETVNAWTLEAGDSLLVIDAGRGPHDLAEALPDAQPLELLITHTHRDHIGGLPGVRDRTQSLRAPEVPPGEILIRSGDRFSIGGLELEARDLTGHHPAALGYLIEGLGTPVLAVGDALFAGSVGGCPGPDAYASARRTLLAALSGLPPETLILPGHGPATTLATESQRNPFLAAWLKSEDLKS